MGDYRMPTRIATASYHHVMRRRVTRTAAGAAVAVLVVFVAAAPASAANVHSPSLSEQGATAGSAFTVATARFKVPTFTCPASGNTTNSIFAQWATYGAVTANASLTVNVRCNNGGSPVLNGSIAENYPEGYAGKYFPVVAGDVLGATFTYAPATGNFKLVGRNLTHAKTVQITGHVAGTEWRIMNFGFSNSSTTIPTFTRIVFSNLTVDATPVNTATPLTGYDLYNTANTRLLVRAGPFNASNSGFSDIFVHAS
jgi:hypothetical protein